SWHTFSRFISGSYGTSKVVGTKRHVILFPCRPARFDHVSVTATNEVGRVRAFKVIGQVLLLALLSTANGRPRARDWNNRQQNTVSSKKWILIRSAMMTEG